MQSRPSECFKFAYAQRSKLGDSYNSPYQSEIEKVSSYVGNETIFLTISNYYNQNNTQTVYYDILDGRGNCIR